MGISAEWGNAADITVAVAAQGECIFNSDEVVDKPAALVIDPRSGGAMVSEGTASEIATVLDRARRLLAPALAAEALADWKEYQQTHAQLMGDNPEQADQYEGDRLPEVAGILADALRLFAK